MIALAIIGFYLGIMLIVWYCLRFTEFYQDANKEPLQCFAVALWPIGMLFFVGYGAWLVVRRFRFLVTGLDRIVGRVLSWQIHQDEYGTLYRMPSPHGRMLQVKVKDSTGTYWLSVPPNMERAKQAVAWTYNMKEEEFNPIRV